ncbi:uncharacterized protein ACNS7B_011072 [Menidia menidia]
MSAEQKSLSGSILNEVHCLRPLCSHNCCWEAERRLRLGKPRLGKAIPGSRTSKITPEDSFPVITVVNVSEWPDSSTLIETEDDFPEAATNDAVRPDATIGRARTLNFSFHSKRGVQMPNYSPGRSAHQESPEGKPQLSDNSPLLMVKELLFLPPPEMTKSVSKKGNSRKRAFVKKTPSMCSDQKRWSSLKPDPKSNESKESSCSAQILHVTIKPVVLHESGRECSTGTPKTTTIPSRVS